MGLIFLGNVINSGLSLLFPVAPVNHNNDVHRRIILESGYRTSSRDKSSADNLQESLQNKAVSKGECFVYHVFQQSLVTLGLKMFQNGIGESRFGMQCSKRKFRRRR
jgi:hypothetical protein